MNLIPRPDILHNRNYSSNGVYQYKVSIRDRNRINSSLAIILDLMMLLNIPTMTNFFHIRHGFMTNLTLNKAISVTHTLNVPLPNQFIG